MIGPVGKVAESSVEFALYESQRPIRRYVSDSQIDVMHLDVAEVMGDDLDHRARPGHHHACAVPETVIKRGPGSFKCTKCSPKLGA